MMGPAPLPVYNRKLTGGKNELDSWNMGRDLNYHARGKLLMVAVKIIIAWMIAVFLIIEFFQEVD